MVQEEPSPFRLKPQSLTAQGVNEDALGKRNKQPEKPTAPAPHHTLDVDGVGSHGGGSSTAEPGTHRAAWTSPLPSPQYFSSCQPLGPGKKSPCPTWWPAGARSSEHGPGMLPGNMVISQEFWPSLLAQTVKNLPAMQETQVGSLGQEDALEEGTATHSSILAWRIPQTEEPGGLQSMRSQSRTRLCDWHFHFCLVSTRAL